MIKPLQIITARINGVYYLRESDLLTKVDADSRLRNLLHYIINVVTNKERFRRYKLPIGISHTVLPNGIRIKRMSITYKN